MRFSLIQLTGFGRKWRAADLADEDLQALESELLENPESGEVMKGTGGLRKMRFAPPSGRRGKSGSMRVGYAVFPDYGRIYLVTMFPKNVQENLTPAERNAVKALLGRIGDALRKGENP